MRRRRSMVWKIRRKNCYKLEPTYAEKTFYGMGIRRKNCYKLEPAEKTFYAEKIVLWYGEDMLCDQGHELRSQATGLRPVATGKSQCKE
ncbi:hypothetical protein TNCV_4580331 [Trichonephila clavipes]|nr:hypothetical protein TNCV_4580331 [Trichonephila clavipes]